MTDYEKYSKFISRSVNHIFKHFLEDESIAEIYETQAVESDPQVAVEIDGCLKGEIVLNFPVKTLDQLTKKFLRGGSSKSIQKNYPDVAGELANLITGTFANQLQYMNQNITLSPPEYNDDPITMKALYDNVNLSFQSIYGGFDIDFYYKKPD
jgi:CheY-specific phosphatase CheX